MEIVGSCFIGLLLSVAAFWAYRQLVKDYADEEGRDT